MACFQGCEPSPGACGGWESVDHSPPAHGTPLTTGTIRLASAEAVKVPSARDGPVPTTRRNEPPMPVINAHITGTVWKIEVKLGDVIEPGTVVAILESMKMEMPVESEEGGTVTVIHVSEGQAVNEDAPLVTVG